MEVRARVVGEPESADPEPTELRVEMVRASDVAVAEERPRVVPTEDAVQLIRGGRSTDASSGGCGCGVAGRGRVGAWAWLALGAVVLGARRRRRAA